MGKEAAHWADEKSVAEATYVATVGPEVNHLDQAICHLDERRAELRTARQERTSWLPAHPEAFRRFRSLDRGLNPLRELPEIQALGQHQATNLRRRTGIDSPGRDHGIELDFGP